MIIKIKLSNIIIGKTPVNAFPLPGDIVLPPKIVARADVRVDLVLPEDYYCNNLHNLFFFVKCPFYHHYSFHFSNRADVWVYPALSLDGCNVQLYSLSTFSS